MAYLISPETFSSKKVVEQVKKLPEPVKFAAKGILALPFTFHSFNGLRHLAWDSGKCTSIYDHFPSYLLHSSVSTLLSSIVLENSFLYTFVMANSLFSVHRATRPVLLLCCMLTFNLLSHHSSPLPQGCILHRLHCPGSHCRGHRCFDVPVNTRLALAVSVPIHCPLFLCLPRSVVYEHTWDWSE